MARNKFEKQLFRSFLNENFEQEEQGLTAEQKKSFTEAVGNYHSMGESIYRNASLREITEQLSEIVRVAESLTLKESEHWFDNVTTSRHMKQLKESYKVFEKTAGEVHTLQQRLESAYEDMGGVLNKYYKINEALKDVDGDGDVDDADSYLDNRNKTITKVVKSEDINIDAKTLKKINPNLLKKLAKKMDINIDEDINIDAKTLKKINPNLLKRLAKKMNITIDELAEKLVFYKDKEGRLRRFDTDKGSNKKYQ